MSKHTGWIQTRTGDPFWPFEPDRGVIRIEDIAHSLANECRFGGHCSPNYNVAQHSVIISMLVPNAFKLRALLHDAGEAYLKDLPRPVKYLPELAPYREAIHRHFGLPDDEPAEIKPIHQRLLQTEQRDLMPPAPDIDDRSDAEPFEWHLMLPSDPMALADSLIVWDHETAKRRFLDRFASLTRVSVAAGGDRL
jgi:hypothetical protein